VRPSAAWVVPVPRGVCPRSAGTAIGGAAGTGARRSLAAASVQARASGLPAGKRAQGSAKSIPERVASCASCSAVSRDEWFCGWPSVASPYPLTV
jgi:hypothetical protein